jgi:hypothetical protein
VRPKTGNSRGAVANFVEEVGKQSQEKLFFLRFCGSFSHYCLIISVQSGSGIFPIASDRNAEMFYELSLVSGNLAHLFVDASMMISFPPFITYP